MTARRDHTDTGRPNYKHTRAGTGATACRRCDTPQQPGQPQPSLAQHRFRDVVWAGALAAVLLLSAMPGAKAKDRYDYAWDLQMKLRFRILPYWFDTAQDTNYGGYVLADSATGRGQAKEKQLVSQARMIWGFAHAHRKGYSDEQRNYLDAAAQGYRFLQQHFLDRQHGGYFWKTDLQGRVLNPRKILYGQAFVIYALVEYVRAGGPPEALQAARSLYDTLWQRAHDPKHGGWIEHFEPDWQAILKPMPGVEVEVPGYKSANTHLHMMEALAELAEVTNDPSIKRALAETLDLNKRYFYPRQPGRSCFHRQLNWKPVTDPNSAGLSYGHNVEFAWLMLRAEAVLERRPSWAHFEAHLRHSLRYGYDHQWGGFYARGLDDQPATDADKIWWVQAEGLAALTVAVQYRPDQAYIDALEKLLDFVTRYQADRDGIWLDTLTADGKVKNPAKAHNWKANYHDVRALIMFVEAFPPSEKPVRRRHRGP